MSDHHMVLRVVAKALIPLILLFAFYVQFHGEYSPGGGFQAGALVAAAVILYALIFGLDEARRAIPPWVVRVGCALGVLLFAGVGVVTTLLRGHYLDYDVLMAGEGHGGQVMGIILVELGVLFSVASVLVAIFYGFAGREPEIDDEDW